MKEEIKAHINYLTHFDPVQILPNEVVLQIFSYLSPRDLLITSTVSQEWRLLSQDEEVWHRCFLREGWAMDRTRITDFENLVQQRGVRIANGGTKNKDRPLLERRESKKRKTEEAFSEGEGAAPGPYDTDGMEGVELIPADARNDPQPMCKDSVVSESTSMGRSQFKLAPTLFRSGPDAHKLSWSYIYKQRRRLEANWDNGLYQMFQLPHRDHPEEGHEECVYTIQHTTKHLVSGSRDQTIRVWDLDTNRLKYPPLKGHHASVLCLQFDECPEHDIIISGGSDSHIIIWKFSTGEMIKKLADAHREPVLNLRFDHRYIVSCSKDKTIKIWNRHALRRDSPLIPFRKRDFFNSIAGTAALIEGYTLLDELAGHHAAVNAVVIHNNTIVSASGDRTIRAWDISTSRQTKTYAGHTKGIACVQFDGRRVVSGSSDKTVRIFDAEQQAEIACLAGHTDLVRTVQARFGDLDIVTDEELLEEARQADRGFFGALARGMQPAGGSRSQPRNAGSSRPENMQSIRTGIPPGGGGSRWAKIVSGSYDETVIVWKKDVEGNWQAKHRLHQHKLLQMNGQNRRLVNVSHWTPPATTTTTQAGEPSQENSTYSPAAAGPASATVAHASPVSHSTQIMFAAAHNHLQQMPDTIPSRHAALPHSQPLLPNSQLTEQANMHQHPSDQLIGFTARPPVAAATNNTSNAGPSALTAPAPAPGPVPQLTAMPVAPRSGESNRVFKLQFDARRIVCCSQNRTIIGWDFANGDPELARVGNWSRETS